MPENYPGIFIVFEGLDGAGCTTQLEMLEDFLSSKGYPVESTKEPSNGPFGSAIRLIIEERLHSDPVSLALAFATDRIDHLHNEANGIIKALKEHKVVLCDRYVLSSMAYQRAFIDDPEWLAAINKFAFNPDLTFFIDTPVEECCRRINSRSSNEELFHKANVLSKVQENYRYLFNNSEQVGKTIYIDGTQSREEQHLVISKTVSDLFKHREFKTLFT